ncbi:MAG: type II toxin-antitoxin system PemK/MazF family toxin [Cyclobacteriaceae bacterium]
MEIRKYDVVLVRLDPTVGKEIQKTRPAIIVSPDEINKNWSPVVIVPLTSALRPLDFRVDVQFDKKKGQAAIDQIKAVDKSRILKKLGSLSPKDAKNLGDWMKVFFED